MLTTKIINKISFRDELKNKELRSNLLPLQTILFPQTYRINSVATSLLISTNNIRYD